MNSMTWTKSGRAGISFEGDFRNLFVHVTLVGDMSDTSVVLYSGYRSDDKLYRQSADLDLLYDWLEEQTPDQRNINVLSTIEGDKGDTKVFLKFDFPGSEYDKAFELGKDLSVPTDGLKVELA